MCIPVNSNETFKKLNLNVLFLFVMQSKKWAEKYPALLLHAYSLYIINVSVIFWISGQTGWLIKIIIFDEFWRHGIIQDRKNPKFYNVCQTELHTFLAIPPASKVPRTSDVIFCAYLEILVTLVHISKIHLSLMKTVKDAFQDPFWGLQTRNAEKLDGLRKSPFFV